jgi:hypothetical protein
MILRPQQIYLLRMSGRTTLANGGGGGGSSSSTQKTDTTSNLTNNVTSTDSRSVASDSAIALGGANDSVTQNSSTSNSYSNSGNTSTSTAFASNSNNTNTNSGNTTSSINYTTTDFGSVQSALDAMKTTAGLAVGLSGSVAGDAISALTHQSDNSLGMVKDLFNFAAASSANSQGTAMQALGLANNSTAAANLASSDVASQAAKDKNADVRAGAAGVVLAFVALKK